MGDHRLDLLVEGVFIVELKAVSDIDDVHRAQVLSYLKAIHLKTVLIINFA